MALQYIYTVRHGEAEGNVGKFVQSPTTKLTENGHEQAKRVAERVKHLSFSRLLVSDMTRAQETASYIEQVTKVPTTIFPALHEFMNPSKYREIQHDAAEFQDFLNRRANHFKDGEEDWKEEDGESFTDMKKRATEVITEVEKNEENIVLVSHGVFLKFLTLSIITEKTLTPNAWFLMGHRMQMGNTSISVFVRDTETNQWSLRTWGDQAHFAE